MDIKFETNDYVISCNEDISSTRGRIYEINQSLEKVQGISGLKKLMHMAEINQRLRHLRCQLEKQEQELKDLEQELKNYLEHGIEYYIDGEGKNDSLQMERIKKRKNKLEIIVMVELGMM